MKVYVILEQPPSYAGAYTTTTAAEYATTTPTTPPLPKTRVFKKYPRQHIEERLKRATAFTQPPVVLECELEE